MRFFSYLCPFWRKTRIVNKATLLMLESPNLAETLLQFLSRPLFSDLNFELLIEYSWSPNKRGGPFINFWKIGIPPRALFGPPPSLILTVSEENRRRLDKNVHVLNVFCAYLYLFNTFVYS